MRKAKKNGVEYLKSVMTKEDYQNILRGSSVAQGEKIKANSKMMGGMLPDISKMKYGGKMKNC